jgi:septal ring factor EnvC (AmiA/AmiB activator)
MTPAELAQLWPLIGGLAAGLLPWIKLALDAKKDRGQIRTDLVKIAQEAAAGVITELRKECQRLQVEITSLEREVHQLRRQVAERDARTLFLEGELRQTQALLGAYERLLDAHDIPHSKPGQPVWQAKDGGLLMVGDAA